MKLTPYQELMLRVAYVLLKYVMGQPSTTAMTRQLADATMTKVVEELEKITLERE